MTGRDENASQKARNLNLQQKLRSEEHTSELQSQSNIVCRLLLEKKRIIDVRADRISQALEEDSIVLVAGFQGVSTESRDVTTLGRVGCESTDGPLRAVVGGEGRL